MDDAEMVAQWAFTILFSVMALVSVVFAFGCAWGLYRDIIEDIGKWRKRRKEDPDVD